MIVLQVHELVKTYGDNLILDRISFAVHEKEKLALVGKNGSGKSTLLDCITGNLTPDSGNIFINKNLKVGYLKQLAGKYLNHTLWEAVMSGFSQLAALREEIKAAELLMAASSKEISGSLARRYENALHNYETNGGYVCESLTRGVLLGLGFNEKEFSLPVNNLSGGQKTLLCLSAALVAEPDLLILDEPTNHLDIRSVEWLENHLRNYRGTLLTVSHDRRFLNNLASRVIELNGGQTCSYPGNYAYFLKQREIDALSAEKAFKKQQDYIAKTEEFITRNRAGIKSRQAAGREKQLQRLARLSAPNKSPVFSPLKIHMKTSTGNQVLKIDIEHCGFDKPLLLDSCLELRKGEKVGLIGPNGSGKSTLLKLITGKLKADVLPSGHFKGQITFGSRVIAGYFSQEFESLNQDHTLLREILQEFDFTLEEARSLLGRILFSGDAVEKKISQLSGGEKARLAILKIILSRANFLILDEPTNHLDLESCEVIENMLSGYEGTLLLVTHDRYLLDSVVDRIVSIENRRLQNFSGNYSYYLEKRNTAELASSSENSRTVSEAEHYRQIQKDRQRRHNQTLKRIALLEKEIEVLTEDKKRLEEKMEDQNVYSDYQQVDKISREHQELETALNKAEEEWFNLQEELSEAASHQNDN
ncbi:MAG: ABC-F family ATP-binding cassette domain-containing protein [Syntrophomonadaceae bacterium]|nr:ABC-F family ATP-binding cassette domain-containing protein [Syntrophomonadaceae bacterium]